MAEGFLRHLYGDRYEVYSAGLTPTHVNPYAIEVMREAEIDISNQRSKSFKEYLNLDIYAVITTCDEAREACPFFPAKKFIHWNLPDPTEAKGSAEEVLKAFRNVRDSIRDRVLEAVRSGEI